MDSIINALSDWWGYGLIASVFLGETFWVLPYKHRWSGSMYPLHCLLIYLAACTYLLITANALSKGMDLSLFFAMAMVAGMGVFLYEYGRREGLSSGVRHGRWIAEQEISDRMQLDHGETDSTTHIAD